MGSKTKTVKEWQGSVYKGACWLNLKAVGKNTAIYSVMKKSAVIGFEVHKDGCNARYFYLKFEQAWDKFKEWDDEEST